MQLLKRYFYLIPITLALFGVGYWITNNLWVSQDNKNQDTNTLFDNILPTPTPFFLQDITIPSLRVREYSSAISDLKKYEENASYTSYLTSYDSDGNKVNGLLTIPKSEIPNIKFPAIVFVHGYIAPTIYKTTERYNAYVDYLARNGYVVFKIDLRGHGESEGEPGGAYYDSDYVVDTLNAYSALQNTGFVNADKIGLWGHSMAGNVTFRSLVAKQNIPAIVIWAGAGYTYSDLSDYSINDQSYRPPSQTSERARRRQQMREVYGEFDPNHWFWKQVPATNYLEDVRGALQIHHALNDSVVGIEYSRNLMKVLDGSEIESELYEYPTGGHNIESPAFNLAMDRTVKFFDKYLKISPI